MNALQRCSDTGPEKKLRHEFYVFLNQGNFFISFSIFATRSYDKFLKFLLSRG